MPAALQMASLVRLQGEKVTGVAPFGSQTEQAVHEVATAVALEMFVVAAAWNVLPAVQSVHVMSAVAFAAIE